MQSIALRITGMTCQHCVMAVTRALRAIPGVRAVDVSLDSGRAIVSGAADPDLMVRAIEQAGYRALLAD